MASLSNMEKDTLAEVGNIAMGSAATALAILTGRTVHITTPRVSVGTLSQIKEKYAVPCLLVSVNYTHGLEGTNMFVLKESDVSVVAALMMGMAPEDAPIELGEMEISAIGEAMNQMIAAAATAMSNLFQRMIDISFPVLNRIALLDHEIMVQNINVDEDVVSITFHLVIENLVDSTMEQIIPLSFAKETVGFLLGEEVVPEADVPADIPEDKEEALVKADIDIDEIIKASGVAEQDAETEKIPVTEAQPAQEPHRILWSKDEEDIPDEKADTDRAEKLKKLDMVRDVPIKLAVILGKTKIPLGQLFDTGIGGLVALNQYAGESVEIQVNEKPVARGEVVVVNGKLGVRIVSLETVMPGLLSSEQ